MIREVIRPQKNTYVLNLPNEMIGKTIEVIAFEIENSKDKTTKANTLQDIKDIQERYSRYPAISHDNYQFNRDEANNYE
jgi:hypothetical protein